MIPLFKVYMSEKAKVAASEIQCSGIQSGQDYSEVMKF